MSNDILEQFRRLDSTVLLHYAAFELQDYSSEAQGFLRTVLFERGIDEAQIRAYRLKRFPFPTMDIVCANCGESLTIERQELNDGTYICPECHSTEAVPYPEIPIDENESVLTGRNAQKIAANSAEAGSPATLEMSSDPLKDLGQGSATPKLHTMVGVTGEEVRFMEEGLPDSNCAKCGKLLEPENTFMAGDNFYCEKCYDEIPESERKLSSEEGEA